MKPVDFRNETFNSLQERIEGSRAIVYAAWAKHGPCTTEQLAERSSLSILSLRPRTTELYQLGFIACIEEEPSTSASNLNSRGARYRVRTQPELATWLAEQHREASNPQRELAL